MNLRQTGGRQYRASLDATAIVITSAVFLLFGFLAYRYCYLLDVGIAARLVMATMLIATAVFAWLYAPLSYEVDDVHLIIKRPAGNIIYPLNEMKSVREINRKELGTLIRLWGSGGMFGYYGHFRSTRMGKLKLYTTRRNHLVLITTTDDELILLSPDDLSIIQRIASTIEP